jgi:hypothetical protein
VSLERGFVSVVTHRSVAGEGLGGRSVIGWELTTRTGLAQELEAHLDCGERGTGTGGQPRSPGTSTGLEVAKQEGGRHRDQHLYVGDRQRGRAHDGFGPGITVQQ